MHNYTILLTCNMSEGTRKMAAIMPGRLNSRSDGFADLSAEVLEDTKAERSKTNLQLNTQKDV